MMPRSRSTDRPASCSSGSQLVIADRREQGEPIPETGWAQAETIDVAA
jgi:hypothetical protein